jgi:hypothetical protein
MTRHHYVTGEVVTLVSEVKLFYFYFYYFFLGPAVLGE